MKLFKADNKNYGLYYFTTMSKLGRFLGSNYAYVRKVYNAAVKLNTEGNIHFKMKGWNIEILEDADVLTKLVDPNMMIMNGKIIQF